MIRKQLFSLSDTEGKAVVKTLRLSGSTIMLVFDDSFIIMKSPCVQIDDSYSVSSSIYLNEPFDIACTDIATEEEKDASKKAKEKEMKEHYGCVFAKPLN